MILKLRHKALKINRFVKRSLTSSEQGFTLIELLISIAIAGIIVSILLSFIIDLLRIEQREVRLGRVQQDTQRAIDYIGDDIQEAVYVYPDPTSVGTAGTSLRALLNDPNMPAGTDILAFWRPTQIDEADIPATVADCQTSYPKLTGDPPATDPAELQSACQELLTRRAAYSLVMYIHVPFDANGVWDGQSHLIRYELPRYKKDGSGDLVQRDGYVDPSGLSVANSRANDFENWAPSGPVDGRDDVLVDFISPPVAAGGGASPDCDAITDTTATTYLLSPPTAAENTGFFTCVRNPDVDLASLSEVDRRAVQASGAVFRGAQDVYLFLQGDANAEGASQLSISALNPASDASRLPTLTSQIMVRGVVDRGTSQ